ncbi:predicted protein [Nematostella vectensis]|uniref:Uncharacterized protein n=1 Tax=Nematostella vectensis TaxID=45351 RepID=A7T815_NEMVE|nr:predicted protein [Nematostella vectensis]|eukprot:XP_001619981.1 hypothetical protein NEMVEDRAFT_v1g223606 [Nematostella vectensis]
MHKQLRYKKFGEGPFREPQEVWKQRHKKLNPTLRVDTSYTSAEQARFVPFTHRTREYEPLLHSTSAFGSLPYGTKYFRESDPGRHITSKRFETVTSPIPIFEQYGKTY